jgi:hypothetical protein
VNTAIKMPLDDTNLTGSAIIVVVVVLVTQLITCGPGQALQQTEIPVAPFPLAMINDGKLIKSIATRFARGFFGDDHGHSSTQHRIVCTSNAAR